MGMKVQKASVPSFQFPGKYFQFDQKVLLKLEFTIVFWKTEVGTVSQIQIMIFSLKPDKV